LVVQKIQRVQIQKRLNTEKKITELQLKIVRNQMDPHFTMNALNSVIGALNRNEKETASENLMHFIQMYRSLVLSADKFKITIEEEINFTENYLKLEQYRFKDKLDYSIRLDESVEKGWSVPKMIIQNPVENAIKHGLSKKDGKGKLEIELATKDNQLIINVTDNGIGRPEAAKSDEKSTGKGLQMMAQFYDLYYQITKVKIKEEIHDLKDEHGNPSGTMVCISIPIINQ
jgi:LytS/YehU family sensor histidine kinase